MSKEPSITKSGTGRAVPNPVNVAQLLRGQTAFTTTFAPADLPSISAFLASPEGRITVDINGKISTDAIGSQVKRLRCIITGWFEVRDAVSFEPVRFDLDIDSRLVVVEAESMLPALEDEPDDEDYIVCSGEFDVAAHVQEEILLALPLETPATSSGGNTTQHAALPKSLGAVKSRTQSVSASAESPFAKLATLKKSG
jgi:uncharacterized metal-binding protein YceD (DUF177 family)